MPNPLPILLFLLGAVLGAAANVLIYWQRFEPRPVSPWMPPSPEMSRRRWFDFLPIFGWLSLRRESSMLGAGFWIRPLLVELLMGAGVAALYQFEMNGGLLPPAFPRPFSAAVVWMLQCQFAAHVALIFWMTVAALIDADETIIPDSIIIPGTLMGLTFAVLFPQSLLPANVIPVPPAGFGVVVLDLCSPNSWPAWLNAPFVGGLSIGLACWLLWCFALLPRTWYSRHGARRALSLCLARIRRDHFSLVIAGFAIVGGAAIAVCWHLGGPQWTALLSALVGMAGGAVVIWAVRIVGSAAMKREAMGFGDVTLMAMIGAFLGWQAALVVFFLAPFAALAYGLFRLFFSRQREIAYGPFLCPAALATIIFWDAIWDRTYHVFALGWLVPAVLAACVPLIPLMLYGLRLLREGFGGE